MESRRFGPENVDRAIDHVIENGAENNGATVYYTLVFGAAGLPAPQDLHQGGDSHLVSAFMEAFQRRCDERGLPPLDALVVHVAGHRVGRPGTGYFRVNRQPDPFSDKTPLEQVSAAVQFWQDEVETCRAWGVRSRRGQV